MTVFKPEGWRIHSDENRHACRSLPALQEAAEKGLILEARASLCTTDHDLIVDLGSARELSLAWREPSALMTAAPVTLH